MTTEHSIYDDGDALTPEGESVVGEFHRRPHPDPTAERITLEDLMGIEFISSAGSRDNGLCIMTAAAWLAGEPHTDAPSCVAWELRALVIPLNDRMPKEFRNSKQWKSLAQVLVGTTTHVVAVKRQRAFACADWAVRAVAPLALTAAGRPEWAAALSGLAAITDKASALLARDALGGLAAITDKASALLAREDALKVRNAVGAAYAAVGVAYAVAAAAAAAAVAAVDADAVGGADGAAAAVDAAVAYAAVAARKKMWESIMETLVPLVRRLAAMGRDGE